MEGYIKDYDKWNIYKQSLNITKFEGICREREVWWCALGVNIGSEEDGKNENFERPVLIFRKFGEETSWVIPLSSKVTQKDSGVLKSFLLNNVIRTAKLSQLRLVSNRRFLRYIGLISEGDFFALRESLSSLI